LLATEVIDELTRKAAARDGTVVYPEPEDPRIIQAAVEVARRGIARVVLVGDAANLPGDLHPDITVQPVDDRAKLRRFAADYVRRRDLSGKVALRLVRRPLIFGAMMVGAGAADGMVAGISHATASVIQAAALGVGYSEGISSPSSCFIMLIRRLGGRRGVPLIFADCAVNIAPSPEELADTALAGAQSARKFLGAVPRVAMLSFSTQGSARHALIDHVRAATALAAARLRDGFVEGEFQLDAAISPRVAAKKVKGESQVAGRANVLVFPDLNAGNIAYKAAQYLGGAQAIGPILQGFAKPVNDLSRGASVEDVVAATAIAVLQAEGLT
jgi:phosphate acetyltransferase